MTSIGSYLDVVKRCDSAPYPHEPGYTAMDKSYYKFLSHDGVCLGRVLPLVVPHLEGYDSVLKVDHTNQTITISSSLKTVSERSETMSRIIKHWRDQGTFECLKGWRDELYSIYNPTNTVYMFVERCANCLFGFATYGVHIVGYVPATDTEEMKIWVPQRSKDKATNPGKLDNTVAGGIGYPHGVFETVLKECAEEAGLGEEYVKSHITPAGVVSYNFRATSDTNNESGVFQPEVEYVYDLVMDPGVTPEPVDGEVEQFFLMPVSQVKKEVCTDKFKYNCALIQIDFFIRHGIIGPEDEPGLLEIQTRSHRRLEHPTI